MSRKEKREIIKVSAVFAALFLIGGIAGKMDYETEIGIHKTTGTVCDNTILTENGRGYTVNGFKDGSKVTIELDGQGNILSVKSK